MKKLKTSRQDTSCSKSLCKVDLLQTQTRLAQTRQLRDKIDEPASVGEGATQSAAWPDVLTEFEVQPVLEATGTIRSSLEEPAYERCAIGPRFGRRTSALQAEQDLRAKKAEYIPDVAAEFNNLSFMNWGRYMPSQTMSIGVSLTWEPFDWGRKKHETAEKLRTVEQARIAKQRSRKLLCSSISTTNTGNCGTAGRSFVWRDLRSEAAVENLRVTKNRYSLQAVLVKDVLQAQVGLEQSNADYQQALTSFWNARADLERALGED